MRIVVRIPPRFMPIYEEAKQAARFRRLNNPDPRTAAIRELQESRRRRDREAKIHRTTEIARLRTAERKRSNSSTSPEAASSASRPGRPPQRERRGNVIVVDFGGGRG